MVDQARKNGIIQMEFGKLIQDLAVVKRLKQERLNYQGQAYEIHSEVDDGESSQKAKSAKKAVKTIVDKGFNLPTNLRFYCIQSYSAQNRAFNKDPGWNDIGYITLGTKALADGQANAISATNVPGFCKGDITCIHEIGHVLHAHALGDAFHDANGIVAGAAPACAGQVSGYALMNKKEFIAEVFAGLMIGRNFSNAVMTEYMNLGGPH